MIVVFRDDKKNFHVVRIIRQEGLGLAVQGYCGAMGSKEVEQLPIEFLGRCCEECEKKYIHTKEQA